MKICQQWETLIAISKESLQVFEATVNQRDNIVAFYISYWSMKQYYKTAKSLVPNNRRLFTASQLASTGIPYQWVALQAMIQGHNLFYLVLVALHPLSLSPLYLLPGEETGEVASVLSSSWNWHIHALTLHL